MKKSKLLLAPALALGASALMAAPAFAAGGSSYQAELKPMNYVHGSGTVMLTLNGDQATVTEKVSGLATTFSGMPYPHVQHIHIDAKGVCPTMSADTNHDGVISTTEGHPFYGMIGTTLSTSGDTSAAAATDLKVAPGGGTFTYQRTFTLNAATKAALSAGTAVVVVHGLDPATLPKAAQNEKSDLVPSLPLAATSPALCGTLTASQMSQMPSGAAGTGGGSTSGIQDEGMLALGGGLVLAAGGALAMRRRLSGQQR